MPIKDKFFESLIPIKLMKDETINTIFDNTNMINDYFKLNFHSYEFLKKESITEENEIKISTTCSSTEKTNKPIKLKKKVILEKFSDTNLCPIDKSIRVEEYARNIQRLKILKVQEQKKKRELIKKENLVNNNKIIMNLADYTFCEGEIHNSTIHFSQVSLNNSNRNIAINSTKNGSFNIQNSVLNNQTSVAMKTQNSSIINCMPVLKTESNLTSQTTPNTSFKNNQDSKIETNLYHSKFQRISQFIQKPSINEKDIKDIFVFLNKTNSLLNEKFETTKNIKTEVSLGKHISKKINNWNVNFRNKCYDSGNYNLPLFHEIK